MLLVIERLETRALDEKSVETIIECLYANDEPARIACAVHTARPTSLS
jgi:hypothetical protein